MKYLAQVIAALLDNKLRRATKFVSPTRVINAHRISWKRGQDNRNIDIRIKIGVPNFHERKFIKDCIAAGEPFPVKKIKFAHFKSKKRKKRYGR